jgi:S-(hydroxymethyl)glutathione dehydrogenase/alcohol dehydrogenase
VIATGINGCGRCYFCVRGDEICCETLDRNAVRTPRLRRSDGAEVGAYAGLGTFAEILVVPEGQLVPVETGLPDEQLALIGCGVMTGVGAVLNTARVEPGSTVAVFGGGGVGQSVLQGARIAGASAIVLVDPFVQKWETAMRLGATSTVDPAAVDPVEAVREPTHGRGCDYVFEAAGNYEACRSAFAATRRGGTTVLIGGLPPDVAPPWSVREHHLSGKAVIGCLGGSSRPLRTSGATSPWRRRAGSTWARSSPARCRSPR